MPKALSQDLWARIMGTYEAGGVTQQAVADRFNVGVASVVRLTRLKREKGHLHPGVGGPGIKARSIDAAGEELLRSMLEKEPDLTLGELVDRLHERIGCQTSDSSVGRALARMGITKKKTLTATERGTERVQELRESHEAWQQTVDAGRVFCIDETGSTVAMTRTHGRAPRGQPVHGRVPRCRGKVITIIGTLTLNGLVAVMTVLGGTSGEVFLAYVREVLGPELRPGDVVVLDNPGAHKDKRVRAEIEGRGAKLVFQPPYSPDKNPIELTWAWLKQYLRTAEARSREAIDTAIAWAMELLPKDAPSAWFRHCGYVNQ